DSGWSARTVGVAAGLLIQAAVIGSAAVVKVVGGQLFSHAHSLEVHTENRRDARPGRAIVPEPVDFIDDALNLELIILDGADHTVSTVESADICYFRRVKIL